jgi:uncharacterized repeat protein (TIGR03843 family)
VPEDERPPTARVLTLLAEGEVEVVGRMPWSSNRTFLVTCTLDGEELAAIYKPGRGERQLWDFPDGLFRREAAAYALSDALGWDVVPETIVRDGGPYGYGSYQRFVPADFSQHHFTLVEDPAHHERLRAIAAFDVVANNADRKSGHCLLGEDGAIWAIDNGLSFHREPKLRTVIWEFAGEPLPPWLRPGLSGLADTFPERAGDLLGGPEIRATLGRARRLLEDGEFPEPDPDRYHFPWPLV